VTETETGSEYPVNDTNSTYPPVNETETETETEYNDTEVNVNLDNSTDNASVNVSVNYSEETKTWDRYDRKVQCRRCEWPNFRHMNGSCIRCPANCESCDFNGCIRAREGFTYIPTNETCEACSENCLFCDRF
jgi:hypothetical protein